MSLKETFIRIIEENSILTKRNGRNTFILCPFHQDKNPSMIINDYTGYCFACEEKYTFREILEKYGINTKVALPSKEGEKHYRYNEILENYLRKSKSKLMELLNSKSYISDYLLNERNVKKQVLEKEDIGILIKDDKTLLGLETLKKEYPEFKESVEKLIFLIDKNEYDTILFFYRNSNFNISSIKFRTPRLDKRFQFKFWKKGKKTGLWGLKGIKTNEKKLVGVEGEFNLLSLKSVLPETNVIALGSASNFDVLAVKDIVEKFNMDFYYCYDNDKSGFKVVEELKNFVNVYAFTTFYYNDLDEAKNKIKDNNEFIKYLKKIVKTARLFKRNTKKWNERFYNIDDFEIKNNMLYYKGKKISNTPFLIEKIIVDEDNHYFIEIVDKDNNTYIFPQEILLDENKNIQITKYGFTFTSMEGKILALFVKNLLMENEYPVLKKEKDSFLMETIL